ncbi:MAG TPA: glycosyltransferase [Gemmatimonadaceae bacterium]
MRVLHLPYTYFPEPSGGTEVYVAELARALSSHAVASSVVFASPARAESYEWEGVAVRRISVPAPATPETLYSAGSATAVREYLAAVEDIRPDVVHVHAYTPALNGTTVRAIAALGIPVVATYHTPTVTCQRGTLLRYGSILCDGAILVGRCSSCVLQRSGAPRPIAWVVGHLPEVVGRVVHRAGGDARPARALRMPELMRIRRQDTLAFLAVPAAIVAPAPWVRDVLRLNGVPEEKILVSPQGVSVEQRRAAPGDRTRAPGALRAAIFGRLDRQKGIHVVIEALAAVPGLALSLDVIGAADESEKYVQELRALAARDPRVTLRAGVPRSEVVGTIARYDVLLVPSQGRETGPLVVLEAKAAGVPVIGSSIGAISDHVRDGIDGLLVVPDSRAEWANALQRVVNERELLERWRAAILPPRTMHDVAAEMVGLYDRVARGLGVAA